jgi:hypothetical protein
VVSGHQDRVAGTNPHRAQGQADGDAPAGDQADRACIEDAWRFPFALERRARQHRRERHPWPGGRLGSDGEGSEIAHSRVYAQPGARVECILGLNVCAERQLAGMVRCQLVPAPL